MAKTILLYGSLLGALISAFMLISITITLKDNADFSNSQLYGYAGMLVASSFIFLGVKSFRNKENGGYISFGKAFLVGLSITLLASALYSVAWVAYSSIVDLKFEEKYMAHMENQMAKAGKTPEEIEKAMQPTREMMKNYSNPLVKTAFTFIEFLPVGFFVTLVSALILMRKKPVQV